MRNRERRESIWASQQLEICTMSLFEEGCSVYNILSRKGRTASDTEHCKIGDLQFDTKFLKTL